MDIKSVLNRVEKHKGFVYGKAKWGDDGSALVVPVEPRKGSQPRCSICGLKGTAYDRLPERRFQFVPLWGIAVFLLYAMRRVECPVHGVKVEAVPWVVEFGLEHRDLAGVEAIGVDEVHFGKGQQYLTLVYQIDAGCRRLLYVGRERTARTLLRFFHDMGRPWCAGVKFVCSDMWKPYMKVIAKKLGTAVHVLDRFHIVAKLNEAIDQVRRCEVRRMKDQGYRNKLVDTKYCFLKNPKNLTPKQETRLADVLRYDLKSVRAYLLKESFQLFWTYASPYWAEWYLRKWCARAMRSRLDPIKKFVGTIRRHQGLILNWFKARKAYSCGVVEGLNRKVNLITRKAFGFRSFEALQVALYHTLGCLPEPATTHKFW